MRRHTIGTPAAAGRLVRTVRALPLLMVTAASACDNVSWGGIDAAVVPPPPKGEELAQESGVEGVSEGLPSGAVLYYVRRDSTGAELTPVGEITSQGMRPLGEGADPDRYWTRFVSERLREGTELALFRRGRRLGTFIVSEVELPGPGTCPALPRARGATELSAEAGEGGEFLALPKRHAPESRAAVDSAMIRSARRVTIVAPILAERMLRARQAGLPGNWQAAMKQYFAFPSGESADPAFSATFLVGDTLGTGLDDEGYSLFFIAAPDPGATGYDTTFVRYTDYPTAGKAAPRVVDFLDWDRNGESELLLEVYGTRDRWFETVGKVEGEWGTTLRVRCESPGQAAAAQAVADSITRDTIAGSTPSPQEEIPQRD